MASARSRRSAGEVVRQTFAQCRLVVRGSAWRVQPRRRGRRRARGAARRGPSPTSTSPRAAPSRGGCRRPAAGPARRARWSGAKPRIPRASAMLPRRVLERGRAVRVALAGLAVERVAAAVPEAPLHAQGLPPAGAEVLGEGVEERVAGRVAGLAGHRQQGGDRRVQHELVQLAEGLDQRARPGQLRAQLRVERGGVEVAEQLASEHRGGVVDAADRRPALGGERVERGREPRPARRRRRRSGGPRRPPPPARATAAIRRPTGVAGSTADHAARAAERGAAEQRDAARTVGDEAAGDVGADRAEAAGDEVGGIGPRRQAADRRRAAPAPGGRRGARRRATPPRAREVRRRPRPAPRPRRRGPPPPASSPRRRRSSCRPGRAAPRPGPARVPTTWRRRTRTRRRRRSGARRR